MIPNFGSLTQDWKESDSEDELKLDPSILNAASATKADLRHQSGAAGRKYAHASAKGVKRERYTDDSKPNPATLNSIPAINIGSRYKHQTAQRKHADPSSAKDSNESAGSTEPAPSSQTERRSPYWRRWDIWMYLGLPAVACALIFGCPLLGSARPDSSPYSGLLPPRNILQPRHTVKAKFDVSVLDLACQSSQFYACDLSQSLRSLDLKASDGDQEIESLGSILGTLLHPVKMATKNEECSYFSQLKFDVSHAWNRASEIQDSLNAGLVLGNQALALVSKSRASTDQILKTTDRDADGGIWNLGNPAEREKIYRESTRWLKVLEDCTQQLESRNDAWAWEIERQSRLRRDLSGVDKQIERLGIRPGQLTGNEDHTSPSCTAFTMQRVERRLVDAMMRAAKDESQAQSLGNHYDEL